MRATRALEAKRINHLRLVKKGTHKRVEVSYFRLFISITSLFAIIALAQVVQYSFINQYSLENDSMKKAIVENTQEGQELKEKVLTLKSPLRIEKMAKADLKMVKPEKVGYLVYEVQKRSQELALKR